MDYREWCKMCRKYKDENEIAICRNRLSPMYDKIVDNNKKCFHYVRIDIDRERRESLKKCKYCKHMKIEKFSKSIYYKWINGFKGKDDSEDYVYRMICKNEKSYNFNDPVDICDTCDKFTKSY